MNDIVLYDFDLQIKEGDLDLSLSENQYIEIIFESHKGDFKEIPQIGFGANQYLKSNVGIYQFKRDLIQELERDKLKTNIDITNTGILNVIIN